MLDWKRQGGIGASVRIMTGQTALGTGADSPMRFCQHALRCVVALGAQQDIARAGRAVLGSMGVMTPVAFTIDRRLVSDPVAPVAVYFVAGDAEVGLLSKLEAGLAIAVGMMADRAVSMGLGSARFDAIVRVAVDTEFARATGKEKGLIAAMGQVAQVTAPFGERLMPVGKLALSLDGSVACGTGIRPAFYEQVVEICAVRVMAGRAIS